ncbi:hypothetical protein A2379_05195 [Candidatus Amesbacteria bacterium RIFOXYB1_FULL_47_13]|nr:MAG: hypothetical protein A2379_05195 [Candidatus Amesbacteria bacterium RIFOXYB1_FULL_47_13]HBC72501.1 hypothetical protein [Candidatus Amesbacteria bacterium]
MNKPLSRWIWIGIVVLLLWGVTHVLNMLFGVCMGIQPAERNRITGKCAEEPSCYKPFWNFLIYKTDATCASRLNFPD